MNRTVRVFVLVIFAFVPLFFIIYLNRDAIGQALYKAKFLSKRSMSPQYAVQTKTPGLNIAIADTAFLEYISATMHLYDKNAIVDPSIYYGSNESGARHTVSHLRFELVPILTQYVVGLGGSMDFAGRGTYLIENDTLVVRVSLDLNELRKSSGNVKFNMEDMFLDTALQTLVYATGKSGAPLNLFEINKAQKALKENIPTGLFPRPIRIEEKEKL